jgi:hypothetical protein
MTTKKLSSYYGANRKVTSIVNLCSDGTTVQLTSTGYAKYLIPSTWVPSAWKTLVTRTGAGRVNFAALRVEDATSRVIKLRITIDGRVIFNATTASLTSQYAALVAIGNSGGLPQPIDFEKSLLIEGSSSLAESGVNVLPFVNYEEI